jgi:hypothetical protein
VRSAPAAGASIAPSGSDEGGVATIDACADASKVPLAVLCA